MLEGELEGEVAEIVIREARPEDARALNRAIGQIEDETDFLGEPGEYLSWANGFADRLRAQQAKQSAVYLMASQGDEIIGFLTAFAGAVERERGAIFIASVGLRKHWRGHGIGTRLFRAIEDWARARNAWRLELRVDTGNERGLALYKKRGFVVEGRIADAFHVDGERREHFLMGKALRVFDAPSWSPLELEPMPADDPGTLRFAPLRPEEAPLFCRCERLLLAETPFLMKQPEEVLDEAAMAKAIAAASARSDRFALAAFSATGGGEVVVGYGTATREPARRIRHDAFVSLNVLRSHWRQGIGGTLAAHIGSWARENGVSRLTMTIAGHNRGALRFAEAHGFKVEATSPAYAVIDGHTVDRLRLAKLL
jgi:RimJ/RimL family protein N-acetyltransferase